MFEEEEEKEANRIIDSLKKALKNVNMQSWEADSLGNIRGKYGCLVVCSTRIPDRPSMPNAVLPRWVDAEFIAAANPQNVKKLIDRIKFLEEFIEFQEEVHG